MTKRIVVFGALALAVLGCGDGAGTARTPTGAASDKIPIRKDTITIDFKEFVDVEGSEGRGARFIFGSGYDKAIADVKLRLIYKNVKGKRLGTLDWSPEATSEWLASGQQTEAVLGTDLPAEVVAVDMRVLEVSFVDGTKADLGDVEEP